MLFDQHTSPLDLTVAEKLMQLMREKITTHNLTAIICTHNLDHALGYGNRLIALYEGKIVRDYCSREKEMLSLEQIRKECYQDLD
ncbi:MAG: hypothetical protein K2W99_06330 [Chthoniobacterales bacterium]|nr:hypothetical protein [Chthoniobacterales bacterium]